MLCNRTATRAVSIQNKSPFVKKKHPVKPYANIKNVKIHPKKCKSFRFAENIKKDCRFILSGYNQAMKRLGQKHWLFSLPKIQALTLLSIYRYGFPCTNRKMAYYLWPASLRFRSAGDTAGKIGFVSSARRHRPDGQKLASLYPDYKLPYPLGRSDVIDVDCKLFKEMIL